MKKISSRTQGSTWLKWDLHVHTPSSFDYKVKNVGFKELASHIDSTTLDAIAITDHWTLDGYFELKSLISSNKLILPGIELRIDKSTRHKTTSGKSKGYVLQALVIFPDNITREEIEKKFFHHIQLCERKDEYLGKNELINLGKNVLIDKNNATDEEYYKAGCEQAYVDYQEIIDAARTLDGLVCLTYDKYGGFESIDPVKDSIFKTNLVKDCNLIETSKEETRRAFFENEDIIRACGKKTPCFRGSDAHKPEEIGRSYTWIKAEKSFEGLKQIIYFPKERVSFSEKQPSYSFPRIKEVELTGLKKGHCLSSLNEPLDFSDNLSSLIGHPSIGKSTFAEVLACLFGKDTKKVIGEEHTKIESLREENPSLGMKATVMHGTVKHEIKGDLYGNITGTITMDEFPIMYINQGFIDKTARDPKAVSVLINQRMDTSELDNLRSEIKKLKGQLKTRREKYLEKFLLLDEKKKIEANLAEVRKFFDVSNSKEYKSLDEDRKNFIQKERSMKGMERKLNKLIEIMEDYSKKIKNMSIDTNNIKELFPSLENPEVPNIASFLSKAIDRLKELSKKIKSASEYSELKDNQDKIHDTIQELFKQEGIAYTKQTFKQKQNEQSQIEEQLNKNQDSIEECEDYKEQFVQILEQLENKIIKWDQLNSSCMIDFNKGLQDIEIRYDLADKRTWLISVLTQEAKKAWEQFTPKSQRESQKFKQPSEENIQKMVDDLIANDSIGEVITYFIDCLENGRLPIKSDYEFEKWLFGDKSDIIKEFLKLRLNEFAEEGKHQIYYKGKNISREGLSFTERCGALLEIILEKGNEPLLIDQPEENLGASYIAKTFINKLLELKNRRQVILVSHNPNSVVLSDSELILAFDRKDEKADKIDFKAGAIESPGINKVICNIIEGGKAAFDLRSERYKSIDSMELST